MSGRFTPNVLLSAAVAIGILLAAVMLGLAMNQRWRGLGLVPWAEAALAWIESVAPNGPSRDIAPTSVLLAITGQAGDRIEIRADDLIEEPDTLPAYDAMSAFFDRQDAITAALRASPVAVETDFLSVPQRNEILPAGQRPAPALPPAFWMQIGVGLIGFWTGAWIWALRRGEWATQCLAIAGAGLMVSAFPAAV